MAFRTLSNIRFGNRLRQFGIVIGIILAGILLSLLRRLILLYF